MASPRTRKSVLDKLDQETRNAVEDAIQHDRRTPAGSIFTRFDLGRFDLKRRSFYDHVRHRRNRRKAPTHSEARTDRGPRSVAAAKSIYVALMLRILQVVDGSLAREDLGDLSRLAAILQAINGSIRLMFSEATDARAEALHKIKLEHLRDDLHRAISEKAETQTCMTEAEARDMIDRIMRGDPPPPPPSG